MAALDHAIAVGDLAVFLRELFEGDPELSDLWVEGEVTGCSRAASGHVYFTLRDDEGQIRCVLFRGSAVRQHTLPQNGMQVAVHGGLSYYPAGGSLQIIVDLVQPAGLGLAALELARLRQRLEDEGLFEPGRKRLIPAMPKVIGVVTSPDGAVWHDIQQVLTRRYPLVELLLSPCSVQGERAPASIVDALSTLDGLGMCDVIIVARGGGSPEDLAAFNDEQVVRAIFTCQTPVVTGVGHETDITLVDLVSDLRAPTPSAAAELCVPNRADLLVGIDEAERRLQRALSETLRFRTHQLSAVTQRLRYASPERETRSRAERLALLRHAADRAVDTLIMSAAQRVSSQEGLLQALEPQAVLRRGYAVLADAESGAPIASLSDTAPGREFIAELADGALFGRIETVSAARRTP